MSRAKAEPHLVQVPSTGEQGPPLDWEQESPCLTTPGTCGWPSHWLRWHGFSHKGRLCLSLSLSLSSLAFLPCGIRHRVGIQHSICSSKNWRNMSTSSTPEGLVEWISKDIWIPQNTITINDAHLVEIWLWGYFCLASMGHGSDTLPPSSSDSTEPKKSWRVIQEIPSNRKHRWWRKRRISVRLGVGWEAVFLGLFRVTELLQHWWKLRTLYPEKRRHHTQTNMPTTSEWSGTPGRKLPESGP